jgi:hypothetical protein
VRFAPRALASIHCRHTWWRTHREKAPGLFGEELRDAIGKLRDNTDVARKQDPEVRRMRSSVPGTAPLEAG